MVTRTEWYERVNSAWPAEIPVISAIEAQRAARRLWRWAMSEPYSGKVKATSGNRYTWAQHGILKVNHEKGWKLLVHDMSHLCWSRANRGETKPHESGHAKLELAMIKEVLKRGWLSGILKTPEKPDTKTEDLKSIRHKRILDRIDGWKKKQQRAERALKKLTRQAKYYERALQG